MKHLQSFSDKKSDDKFEIIYTGEEDPNKDGFLIHLTGYDQCIGNKIIGFYDCGPFTENITDHPKLKKIMDEKKNALTSSFMYCNANDVIDFYSKCIKSMNVGMVDQYKTKLEPFGFVINKI